MNRSTYKHKIRRSKFTISKCYCPDCGSVMTVPRTRNREKFHKKDLWCPICKRKQTMTEVRDFDFVRNMLGEKLY